MRLNIIKKIIYAPIFAPFIFATISCTNPNEHNEHKEKITIDAKTGWSKFAKNTFEKNLENELDNKFDIVFDNSFNSDQIVMNNLLSGKADLSFSSITQINLLKDSRNEFVPKIQTLTNAFTFDPVWTIYSDGSTNDELLKQGTNETKAFTVDFPYQDNKSWNGSIYTNYYDFPKKVDFYRGNIWIYGNANQINSIKKAWANKDWNAFRDFRILHGNTTSGGKFKLQEALLKKHFTKNNKVPFTTLSEEIKNHSDKFENEKVENFAKFSNYHIGFDDNGSFAYTPNKNDNGAKNEKEPFKVEQNKSLEVLTVTEPLKYDIGVFRKDFKYQNILTNALLGLQQKGLDTYGPTYGYNGYKIIKKDDIQKEVYDKWENVLG